MKTLVAYPAFPRSKGIPLLQQNRQFQWFSKHRTCLFPPVTASAATVLQAEGHESLWKDAIAEGLTHEEFCAYLKREQPDLIAFETKTPVVKQYWELIPQYKALVPNGKFVLMGDHVTAFPEESMVRCPELDFVVESGDYDFQLRDLARYLDRGADAPTGLWYRDENGVAVTTGSYVSSGSLDDMPIIDRNLTKWLLYDEFNMKHRPFTYTMAGRDCPYAKCTFCSWTTTHPKFRVRSVENFLDELEMLADEYGCKEVFDDTGTFPAGGWLNRFCEGMIERGLHEKLVISCNSRFDYITEKRAKLMKKAGFRLLKFGLESASQATIDRLVKDIEMEQVEAGIRWCKEAGLDVHLTIMVGYPWETRQDAEATIALARKFMSRGWIDLLQCTVVMPYPGTPLYTQAVDNDWLLVDPTDYDNFDMGGPILRTPDMTPDEVQQMCNGVYQTFLTPGFILNHLKKVRTAQDIWYLARGAKAAFGHLADFSKLRSNADQARL